jgi:ParB family chromosome partitioning protein
MATATKNKGLGKGLSALISENYVETQSTKKASKPADSGINSVSVTKLHSGKYQPRTAFDEGLLTELAESISKNGIMQPIIVRPSSKFAGKFEIIAGERRWRAAKIAGLEEAPVIVREVTDKQALELALVENIQRHDLSALEEAGGYQRLIEEFDYTQEALAETVGKSRSHIANLLRLLSLPEEIKTMLNEGQLTAGHARAILNAPNAVELAHLIVKRGLNVRQAEDASRTLQGHAKRSAPRAGSQNRQANSPFSMPKDPDILALEESLSENLGVRVAINDRGQSGEIVLAYDSLSQLDEILRRLSANTDELI